MRILHVLSQLLSKTGSGVFVESLIREFHNLGHDQWILIAIDHDHMDYYEKLQIPAKIIPVRFDVLYGMSDVMPYKTRIFSDMSEVDRLEYINKFEIEGLKALDDVKPDLVISNHMWLATSVISKLFENHRLNINSKQMKIFAISHGTDVRQMALATETARFIKQSFGGIDKVFTLYDEQHKEISNLYNIDLKRIETLGIACNTDVFYPCDNSYINEDKKINLIYAGKLSFSKGVKELIEAFMDLDPLKYRLYIAGTGSGPEFEVIRTMIDNSQSDIVYLGMLSQEELAESMRRSHIFVLSSYYEGIPLVLKEALLCNCRIISNKLPGVVNLLGGIEDDRYVKFVELPSMKTLDQPFVDGLDEYKKSLSHAIETMSLEIDVSHTICEVENFKSINIKKWSQIAKKLIESFGNVDNI